MSTLESLIGRPLHEIGDDELEEIIMRGRLAREEESSGARKSKATKSAGTSKKKSSVPDVDLDDFEDDFD